MSTPETSDYDDMTASEFAAGIDRYHQDSVETLELRARSLVARESPGSDEEHFERLVARLIAKVVATGNYGFIERAWLEM